MQKAKQPRIYRPNERLREERLRRGWSRVYIAEQIGVADPKTIGRWERGSAFPSAHFLQKLCELFQMSAAMLGLWQGQEPEISATLHDLQKWDTVLKGAGHDTFLSEHAGGLMRAIPVRIGPHTALLIMDDPKVRPEQILDVLQER